MAITFLDNNDKLELEEKIEDLRITVDTEANGDSDNPISNKAMVDYVEKEIANQTETTWVECDYTSIESGVLYRDTDGARKSSDALVSYSSYRVDVIEGMEYRATACINKIGSHQSLAIFYNANGGFIGSYGPGKDSTSVTYFTDELIEIPNGTAYMMVGHYTYFSDPFKVEQPSSIDAEMMKINEEIVKINEKNPMLGVTIVNFGDSIFGKRRPPDDISTELAKLTGANVYNCGFGGCKMASHANTLYNPFSMCNLADAISSGDWTLQDTAITDGADTIPSYFSETLTLLKSLNFSNVDIITIAYGTNDFADAIVLDNENNVSDTVTFGGALRYSLEKLLTAYPHLKIFICGQIYRFWLNEDGSFLDDSDTHTNSKGVALPEFIAKTRTIAENYHLPFIDNYNIGLNKLTRSIYFNATDGTHPIVTGNKLIARHIAKKLF